MSPATSIALLTIEEIAAGSNLNATQRAGDDYTPHGKQSTMEFEETADNTEGNIWE